MFIFDLTAALAVAVILSALFALATRRGYRRTGLSWLFLIIFLATWLGGVWLKPFGPVLWGIHWLTFLLVGFFVALALLALTYRKPPRGREETLEMLERMEEQKVFEEATYFTLSIFFWALLAALVVAIVFRYVL